MTAYEIFLARAARLIEAGRFKAAVHALKGAAQFAPPRRALPRQSTERRDA